MELNYTQNSTKLRRAKKRVEELKEFYTHLAIYCLVMPCLAVFNYITTDFPWVIFPMLGWGFGLFAHAMKVFSVNPFFGKQWEERKIKQFMDEDKYID